MGGRREKRGDGVGRKGGREWRKGGVEKGTGAGADASGALRILTSLLSLKSYIEAV